MIFYYYADKYINFKDLITELYRIYKTRIWMSAVNPASFSQHAIGQPPSGIGPGAVPPYNAYNLDDSYTMAYGKDGDPYGARMPYNIDFATYTPNYPSIPGIANSFAPSPYQASPYQYPGQVNVSPAGAPYQQPSNENMRFGMFGNDNSGMHYGQGRGQMPEPAPTSPSAPAAPRSGLWNAVPFQPGFARHQGSQLPIGTRPVSHGDSERRGGGGAGGSTVGSGVGSAGGGSGVRGGEGGARVGGGGGGQASGLSNVERYLSGLTLGEAAARPGEARGA